MIFRYTKNFNELESEVRTTQRKTVQNGKRSHKRVERSQKRQEAPTNGLEGYKLSCQLRDCTQTRKLHRITSREFLKSHS